MPICVLGQQPSLEAAKRHLVSGVPDTPPLPSWSPCLALCSEMGKMSPSAHVPRCPLAVLTQTCMVCSEGGASISNPGGDPCRIPSGCETETALRADTASVLDSDVTLCHPGLQLSQKLRDTFHCPLVARRRPMPGHTFAQENRGSGLFLGYVYPCWQEPHQVSQLRLAEAAA